MRLESLWGDIRFAFRIFKRSPTVALTVIGTLAVALGLNAVAYSFFNAYLVKPAAVHDPGALYRVSWENRGGLFHRFSWTEAERFGREMAGVFPETYVSLPQLLGGADVHFVMMDTFDVAAFSTGIVIVIAACLVAAFYPARRAAGVEPMVALRIE